MMNEEYVYKQIDYVSQNKLRSQNIEDADEFIEKIKKFAQIKNSSELDAELFKEDNPFYNFIFSQLRSNIISWIPFKKTDSVLIWGSGYGIFVDAIAPCVKYALCVEETYISALTNYYRNNSYSNIDILMQGEKTDFILKENEFQYIIFAEQLYIPHSQSLQDSNVLKTINCLKKYLAKNGTIIFYAGNRMGLKFWSGCKDEFTNGYFSSIEGYGNYEGKEMPSRKDIIQLISLLDFPHNKIYYPYPDYKFATSIYSDSFLPQIGDLTKNAFSWEERLVLFNEVNTFNNIIRENEFRLFTNSFLVVSSLKDLNDLNIFTKYSNDRNELFSIRTDIFKDENHVKHVRKIGNTNAAIAHIKNMKTWNSILNELFDNKKIEINKYKEIENGLMFEFLPNKSLQTLLMHSLDNDQYEYFEQRVLEVYKYLSEISNEYFYMTPEFQSIFGNVELPHGLKCSKINNIDMIFSNILVENDTFKLIDYEWVFDFPIPTKFIIFRSIFMFFHGPRGTYNYNSLYLRKILKKLSIDDDLYMSFCDMEKSFQDYVCKDHIPLRKMCVQPALTFSPDGIQVFYDFGTGFKKAYSDRLSNIIMGRGRGKAKIALTPEVKGLRIDPADEPCLVKIFEIEDNYGNTIKYDINNGKRLHDNIFIFNSFDPQIILSHIKENTMYIYLDIEVHYLSSDITESIDGFIK